MRYSDEFKNHVVSRLLTGEVTIPQAQEQYGVSTFSLQEWRKKALSQASESSAAETHAQESPQMSKLRLPKGVTYLQPMRQSLPSGCFQKPTTVLIAAKTALSTPPWKPGANGSPRTPMPATASAMIRSGTCWTS